MQWLGRTSFCFCHVKAAYATRNWLSLFMFAGALYVFCRWRAERPAPLWPRDTGDPAPVPLYPQHPSVVQSSHQALPCPLLVSLPTCGSLCASRKCPLGTRFPPVPIPALGACGPPVPRPRRKWTPPIPETWIVLPSMRVSAAESNNNNCSSRRRPRGWPVLPPGQLSACPGDMQLISAVA